MRQQGRVELGGAAAVAVTLGSSRGGSSSGGSAANVQLHSNTARQCAETVLCCSLSLSPCCPLTNTTTTLTTTTRYQPCQPPLFNSLANLPEVAGCEAKLRMEGDKPYVTDNSNYIVDLYFQVRGGGERVPHWLTD